MRRERKGRLQNLGKDTETLTLDVLGQTAFGKQIGWTDGEPTEESLVKSGTVVKGHQKSFIAALRGTLDQVATLFTLPRNIICEL